MTTDIGHIAPGADLARADLRDRDLTGCDLEGANLEGADLTGARLQGANLRDAILASAVLKGAQLLGADLAGADLTEVEATGAGLGGADLSGATLFGANLADATLARANLGGADFRVANLTEARLREANLAGADFSRAQLVGSDLTRCDVTRASFRDADLSHSRLKGISGYATADWIGVDLLGADYTGAYRARREIMDQNFLWEFRNQSKLNAFIYKVWWLTSDCGRSFVRWGLWTIIVAVLFAMAYTFLPIDYGSHPTVLSPLYFSVVTLTTLGYGDVLPMSMGAQVVVMLQVIMGYVMLGGLLSIFAAKMGRRAE